MQFNWDYVFSLIHYKPFWISVVTVIELSVATWVLGILFGFVIALARQSKIAPLRLAAATYIWFFRSLPLLVLLIFVYNLPQLFPATGFVLSNPFNAGLIALLFSESAYIAEIHRGGLLAVPKGQSEAALALGIRYRGLQRMIIIPQAIRVALPTLVNEYITIVKLTSLVSVISLTEILLVGQQLYTQNFMVMETLLAVAFYYVFIVTIFTWLLKWVEYKLDVSARQPRQYELTPKPLKLEKPKTSSEFAIELSHGAKAFGRNEVLKDISFSVKWGEVVSIIGPSGSGKTTLIRTLNGLQDLDQGEIKLAGDLFLTGQQERGPDPMSESHLSNIVKVGMVFQGFNLFPHKTVLENIMLAPRYHNLDSFEAIKNFAAELLNRVGMLEHAGKYPHQLSGGQQQRVAIARALAMNPQIMLFDEPTSALDPELVGDVLEVIEKLAKEGMTMIIVTHEMNFAFSVSDRVVFMESGYIVHNDSPAKLLDEPSARLSQFFRNHPVMEAKVA